MTSDSFSHPVEVSVYVLKLLCEMVSVGCVAAGLLAVGVTMVGVLRRRRQYVTVIQTIRLQFGLYLSLALEFLLAADILATIGKPDLMSLGELAFLAVIRTFLNYFLQRELEEEKKLVQELQSGQQRAAD